MTEDGRKARGRRRRAELIAATLAVVERDGVAGLTHRAVAREVGCPASSAVYYFATLDDLLVAALSAAIDEYIGQLRELVADGRSEVDAIAQLIADVGGPGRGRAMAERELTLLAARRPALRPIAQRWRDQVVEVASQHTDDPATVLAFVDVSEGICARMLLDIEPLGYDEIRTELLRVLGR
ncbi:TetR family transcriptional regulator [Saccharopolyspora taberi]|uniref:TetR family transcriptional regulator n=1 Tax=Saccharopolyspora taberi TaxID=60895 RepID=A0ABN3V3K6_9PSEU